MPAVMQTSRSPSQHWKGCCGLEDMQCRLAKWSILRLRVFNDHIFKMQKSWHDDSSG